METQTVPTPPRLVRPRELPATYPYLTANRVRHLLSRRADNGLDRAAVRLGRLLLIDLDEFDRWLCDQRERRTA